MLSRLRSGKGRRGNAALIVGLFLLLGLLAAALAATAGLESERVPIEFLPAAEAPADVDVVRMRFDLPAVQRGEPAWAVWLPRVPRHSVWLEAYDWRSPSYGFFAPDPAEGVLPGGYGFVLPQRWEGPVEVSLHAAPSPGVALQPRVVRATEAVRLEQAAAAGSAAIYASLLMLLVLALALHAAARDRVFLALFACTGTMMLMLGAVNGHLYAVPGLRVFAAWGGQGLLALVFVFLASWVRLMEQYAGTDRLGSIAARTAEIAFWSLLGAAGVCLLGWRALDPVLSYAAIVSWGLVGIGSLVALVDAGRRGIAMAWPLAGLLLLVLVVALPLRLAVDAETLGPLLTRHLFQGGLVVFLAVCAIGLVHRISEYREQRDRDRLARADTERRMLREAARTDLVNDLQSKLRQVEQKEVAWTAFRAMADHLLPLLPVDLLAVAAEGYHERNILMVDPAGQKEELATEVRGRALTLRRQAANGIAFQQPVTSPAGVSTEAVVPLKVRAPSWGVLILRRAGTEGFAPDEMALASEFCRIAQLQVDQVIAAIKLRQSAELDALTGSLNRRSIDQWLVRSFAEADRDGQQLSVLFVDLDRFKGINDRYGHAVGDQCLRAVAGTLAGALDEGDLFGRYGGEEFIAILPGRGGAAAREVGERLRAAVERQTVECEGQTIKLTVSVGVATRRDGERTPAATIERADKALYAAKRGGRNCVHVAPAVFT